MNNFEERMNENLENFGSLSLMGKFKTAFMMAICSVIGLTGLLAILAGMFFLSEIVVAMSH